MGTFAKLKSIWENNRKTVIIAVSSVLAALFIGSILLAIFVGGEFKKEEVITYDVRGSINIVKPGVYKTDYELGDAFEFDKSKNTVTLIYQYNDEEDHSGEYGEGNKYASVDNLDGDDYGFLINGKGDLYNDADAIRITEDVKYISVAWVKYPHIKVDIAIKIATDAD